MLCLLMVQSNSDSETLKPSCPAPPGLLADIFAAGQLAKSPSHPSDSLHQPAAASAGAAAVARPDLISRAPCTQPTGFVLPHETTLFRTFFWSGALSSHCLREIKQWRHVQAVYFLPFYGLAFATPLCDGASRAILDFIPLLVMDEVAGVTFCRTLF